MTSSLRRRSSVRRRFGRPHRPQRLRPRLLVECLEDRTLLSTGLAPVLPASPLGMSVPGQFSHPNPGAANQRNLVGTASRTLPVNQQLIRAAAAIPVQGVSFPAANPTGAVPAPTPTPAVNLSPVEVVTSAAGGLPANLASLGSFNQGLATDRMLIAISSGGQPSLLPGSEQAQPNDTGRPARVQPAPDDESPPPPAQPQVPPAAAIPIVLAPETGPEQVPGWDLGREVAVVQPAAAPPARPVAPAVAAPRVAPATPPASLWGRFVAVACFAAGALGAVWFPDVRELGAKREQLPTLREEVRRWLGVKSG